MQKNYKKGFNKDLIKKFANIYEFFDGDINKSILLLRKEFMHTNIWIAGKDLMKHRCPTKTNFTVI